MRAGLRSAFRELLARPGLSAIAVVTLALGIAANTVIFTGVHALLLQRLPYEGAERLALVRPLDERGEAHGVAYADYLAWRESSPVFEAMAVSRARLATLAPEPGSAAGYAERVTAEVVSESLLPMLGVRPALGPGFSAEDFRVALPEAVLLSDRFWRGRFGGDPRLVGRSVVLDGRSHRVAGVMPESFQYPRWAQLWLPLAAAARAQALEDAEGFALLTRLRPGATRERARTELAPLVARAARRQGHSPEARQPIVVGIREALSGRYRDAALVMQVTVALVLLIACANLASLLLARQEERRREFALRRALGAGQGRLLRQVLGESLVLSLLGCAFGLLAARWGLSVLQAAVAWPKLGVAMPDLNLPVMLATVALSLSTSLAVGLLPALRAARQDPREILASGGLAATASPAGRRQGTRLAVLQTALAMGLLAGAGLSARAFLDLAARAPGFEPRGRLVLEVTPPPASEDFDAIPYLEALLATVREAPGVRAAGAVGFMPLVGYNPGTPLRLAGASDERETFSVDIQPVTPGYLLAMGIPLLEGRDLEPLDSRAPPRVALVNRTLAERLWPELPAPGQLIQLPEWSGEGALTVVGVVADVRQFGLHTEPRPEIYVPGYRATHTTIVADAGAALPGAISTLEQELAQRRSEGVAFRLSTLESHVARHLEQRRTFVRLLGVFAVLGVGLAALGLYGMSAWAAVRRAREFGIRLALGARPAQVMGLVLGRSLGVAGVGVCLGAPLALALSRVLQGVVHGVPGARPLLLAGLGLAVLAVSLAAAAVPGTRASRVEPSEVLRSDG